MLCYYLNIKYEYLDMEKNLNQVTKIHCKPQAGLQVYRNSCPHWH